MLKDLDHQWNLLSLKEKYQNKGKLAEFREEYKASRIKFFKLEDEELRLSMGQPDVNKLKGRISHQNHALRGQDKTLEMVRSLGIEAHQNMQ